MKRVNANIPGDLHKRLRVALAENETDFSTWLKAQIERFVEETEKKIERKWRKRKGG